MWRDHAYFRNGLSSVGCDLICSTHIPNLKCLRLPACNEEGTRECKNSHFQPLLGELGVTHKVHLWLDGKRVVDFLLAIIELISLALTAAALLSEICQYLLWTLPYELRLSHVFQRWLKAELAKKADKDSGPVKQIGKGNIFVIN